ncbi:MAG: hypothetical protein EBR51_11785 [Gammaproteobacteria bacterium]|nr:hypothetical protein [Gammaproteobacteria bacterium]
MQPSPSRNPRADGPAPRRSVRTRAGVVFRWLHIYVSMASFGILFFFAVTGLTLNHADWFFSDQAATTKSKGTVPIDWVKTAVASAENVMARITVTTPELRLSPSQLQA